MEGIKEQQKSMGIKQQQKLLVIGKMILKGTAYNITNDLLRKTLLQSKQWVQITKSNIWNLKDGDWDKLKASEIFKLIQVIHAKQMKLGVNKNPFIIKSMAEVSFPNLIDLYLNGNMIHSLEQVSVLNAQNLRRIKLANNRITSITPIRRMNISKANSLDLCLNYIVEPDSLTQLNAMILRVIWVQAHPKHPVVGGRRWIFKFHSRFLEDIWFQNMKTLNTSNIRYLMQKKFPNLNHTNDT